jgi:hypothetical protein
MVMAVGDVRAARDERSGTAFGDFYRREIDSQVRRAALLLGSEELANDVVHDAFVAVYRRWDSLDEPGPTSTWPHGDMELTVRLFANGGETVVEQQVSLQSGDLSHRATQTTENGVPVVAPYVFFDGEVRVFAADPWRLSPFFESALSLHDQSGDERVEIVRHPVPVATGCAHGPAPADADALAQSILSDADLVATVPVDVSVGGAERLAMEVTVAPGASVCETFASTLVLTILAIAIVAPEARFDDTLAAAAPIIESIELQTD